MSFIFSNISREPILQIFSKDRKLAMLSITLDNNLVLKRGVWFYFFLLIFEGSLRKWVLPTLATPLLVARDPVAIWLLFMAWKRSLIKADFILVSVYVIGIISLFTGFYLGHGNLAVSFFGARVFLLHFPLIYVIGTVLTQEDVIKIGRVILYISIPMTILIILQFYSPQSAWVNRGVGGDIRGAGFTGALGYFRPPGTFSFTNGVSQFYGLVAPFVFYFWYKSKLINRILLVVATGCLILSISFSISRTLFFSVGVSLMFSLFIGIKNSKNFIRLFLGVLVIFSLFIALNKTNIFQDSSNAFMSRFETANKIEGGVKGVLVDRYLGGMISGLDHSSEYAFFGLGSGMGTNAGAMLLTGEQVFLISEGEWGRLIGELGPLLGLLIIFLRMSFSVQLTKKCFRQLRYNNILPWLLLSFALLNIPQGQWAQPTFLGFGVIAGGLLLASLKQSEI